MGRLTAILSVLALSLGLVLAGLVGCAKGSQDDATARPEPGVGKAKMPTPEQKAAKQAAAKQQGLTPDGRVGPASMMDETKAKMRGGGTGE